MVVRFAKSKESIKGEQGAEMKMLNLHAFCALKRTMNGSRWNLSMFVLSSPSSKI